MTLSIDPLQRGAAGPGVRELQQRLVNLGYGPISDLPSTYADGTVAAVEAFQRARGLAINGEVDQTTWSRLIEAGWQLGHRLLYLTKPHLRGDDVAEMQIRLAQLGFNPGRIDGIFGPLSELALRDFQRNRGLTNDGTLARTTMQELLRMSSQNADRRLVTDARDLAGFDESTSGPLVLCGDSPMLALVADAVGAIFEVHQHVHSPNDSVAGYANDLRACAVLSFQADENLPGVHIHYWASYQSHSRRGEQLASELASELARSHDFPRVEVTGMALPVLRETQMTTLHVEHGRHGEADYEKLAEVIATVMARVFHRNT